VALTQTRAQIRANVRRFTDTGGTNALVRHPDTDLNEYIDRALGSLHRALSEYMPDQRLLGTSPVSLAASTATYPLPADFESLISVDLSANGAKVWLVSYEMHERPSLTTPDTTYTGTPFTYRLRGSNIEYLPTPASAYTSVLWYVPTPTQLSADGSTYDTINRLDDYLIGYASQFIAVKDKNAMLLDMCKGLYGEIKDQISMVARSRDRNSPPRIVDEMRANRWGRRR
jgi:hypothetical protein